MPGGRARRLPRHPRADESRGETIEPPRLVGDPPAESGSSTASQLGANIVVIDVPNTSVAAKRSRGGTKRGALKPDRTTGLAAASVLLDLTM